MCEEKEQFVIDTPEKADWALKKLQEIKRQRLEVDKRADKEIKPIEDWRKKEIGKLSDSEIYFTMLLTEYANNNRDKDNKFRFSSPYGKIYTRNSVDWSYDDEKLIEEYKNTDVVKSKLTLNKNELKKRVELINGKPVDKETGVVVDGVEIEEVSKVNVKTEE